MSFKNTRDAFMERLIDLTISNPMVAVVDPDVGSATKTWDFGLEYPDKFYEMGIAEQNAFGVASGLSSTGLKVFAATFAVFASMRAAEMIRTSICYPKLNVVVIGGYAGLSNGKDGATHQSIEDLAIMRSFPNMTVVACTDSVFARKLADLALEHKGPLYIRMEYETFEPVYREADLIELGKANVIRTGSDVTLVTCGTALRRALEAADLLAARGYSAEVIDMHTLKPIDRDTLLKSVQKTRKLVSLEDHNVIGGLAGALSECLAQENMVFKYKALGIRDVFTESGKTDELRKKYGISAANMFESALNLIEEV